MSHPAAKCRSASRESGEPISTCGQTSAAPSSGRAASTRTGTASEIAACTVMRASWPAPTMPITGVRAVMAAAYRPAMTGLNYRPVLTPVPSPNNGGEDGGEGYARSAAAFFAYLIVGGTVTHQCGARWRLGPPAAAANVERRGGYDDGGDPDDLRRAHTGVADPRPA